MSDIIEKKQLLSHEVTNRPLESIKQEIAGRIMKSKPSLWFSKKRKLQILDELCQFGLGRFLLQNKGLNGYWTHYVLTHPWNGRVTGKNNEGKPLTALERFILDGPMAPTQQRFQIFLKENQTRVKNNAKLACIPCGMMGELLYLDYSKIDNIELFGIDYDSKTFDDAKHLAESKNLFKFVSLEKANAWELKQHNKFDLISSNGLNICESDHKVAELYKQFYQALKPGGKLVTSFLTYPPFSGGKSEWNFFKLRFSDLMLHKLIFMEILGVKWQCYRSSKQTKQQLSSAGFKDIRFIYDEAKFFPTVVAYK